MAVIHLEKNKTEWRVKIEELLCKHIVSDNQTRPFLHSRVRVVSALEASFCSYELRRIDNTRVTHENRNTLQGYLLSFHSFYV